MFSLFFLFHLSFLFRLFVLVWLLAARAEHRNPPNTSSSYNENEGPHAEGGWVGEEGGNNNENGGRSCPIDACGVGGSVLVSLTCVPKGDQRHSLTVDTNS